MDGSLGPVRATTPGDPVYARTLRLLAATVAASAGLEVDRVEDVALATNEAFGQLIRLAGAEAVACTASCAEGSVDITMTATPMSDGGDPPERWPDVLAERVLAGVTDAVEYSTDAATIRFHVGAR